LNVSIKRPPHITVDSFIAKIPNWSCSSIITFTGK
jgi:hypothetical protein